MAVEPEQTLHQVVIAIDQRAIGGTGTAAVAEDARRSAVAPADRSEIAVDERLHDLAPFAAVESSTRGIGSEFREVQKRSGEYGGGRGIAVAEEDALIGEIVPGDPVFG